MTQTRSQKYWAATANKTIGDYTAFTLGRKLSAINQRTCGPAFNYNILAQEQAFISSEMKLKTSCTILACRAHFVWAGCIMSVRFCGLLCPMKALSWEGVRMHTETRATAHTASFTHGQSCLQIQPDQPPWALLPVKSLA